MSYETVFYLAVGIVAFCALVGFGLRSGWLIAEDVWRGVRREDDE